MRANTSYSLLVNAVANATSTKKANVEDFRNIGVTIATSNTAFTGTIRVKGSRVKDGADVDFTTASTQSNLWSYLQITSLNTGASVNGSTGLTLTTSSNEVYNYTVNADGFNWVTVELSGYTAGDVNTDIVLYNNQ